jgi:antitoxin ParD1/3/4
MNLEISKKVQEFIASKIASGMFANESAVIDEAVRCMQEDERQREFIEAIRLGDEQIERGETVPYTKDFMKNIQKEIDEELRNSNG